MSTAREIIADVAFRNLGKPVDKIADAALAALTEAGWQIVPAEPKEETIRRMIVKMLGSSLGGGYGWPEYARDLYMIAAAPLPPPPAKQGG